LGSSMTTDSLPPAASADHLTDALRKAGVLGEGSVRDVEPENPHDTILSHIVRLKLSYDGPATGAPLSLFLKTARSDRLNPSWVAGRQEVGFYTQVAPLLPAGLVPRCFDADWNAETNVWHLLLEDLTETHLPASIWPVPPTVHQCEIILGSLAGMHARWWDNPDLGVSVGTWLEADALERNRQTFSEHLARFCDQYGDRIPLERRELYDRVLDATPRFGKRYLSRRNVTVVHGDAHVWNCLLPRDGGNAARFFDWDSWRIDVGASDLAYMLAMHWYPDRRRRYERLLLDRYHEALLAHGVEAYDRRALQDDYRLSVLRRVTTPVGQAAVGVPPVIWWNNLERIFMAVDDLDCRELLD
jgi:Ecdysteroid kinase-like family